MSDRDALDDVTRDILGGALHHTMDKCRGHRRPPGEFPQNEVDIALLQDAVAAGQLVPEELLEWVKSGGVPGRIWRAARDAAREAAESERVSCLFKLEGMLRELPLDASVFAETYLKQEIARLYREVPATPQRVREQTRERVRRHRERQRRGMRRCS
jgi:hypothetical protein